MKKVGRDLVVGDKLASGEVIHAVHGKVGRVGQSPKISLTVHNEKTGKFRVCHWNFYGTIFLQNPVDTTI